MRRQDARVDQCPGRPHLGQLLGVAGVIAADEREAQRVEHGVDVVGIARVHPANHVVNDLTEAYGNATGPVRSFSAVSKQLVFCQGCGEWDRTDGLCTRHDRERWNELLIRPGKVCERWY